MPKPNSKPEKETISYTIYKEDLPKLISYILFIEKCSKDKKSVPMTILRKLKELFETPFLEKYNYYNEKKVEAEKLIEKLDHNFSVDVITKPIRFNPPPGFEIGDKTSKKSQPLKLSFSLEGFLTYFFTYLSIASDEEVQQSFAKRSTFLVFAHQRLKEYLRYTPKDNPKPQKRNLTVGILAVTFGHADREEDYYSDRQGNFLYYSEYLADISKYAYKLTYN